MSWTIHKVLEGPLIRRDGLYIGLEPERTLMHLDGWTGFIPDHLHIEGFDRILVKREKFRGVFILTYRRVKLE